MTNLKAGIKIKSRYVLMEYKGSGSFGEVWLARDEVLDCEVALKIYISLDSRGVEEFKREYITTLDVAHLNLLTADYFDVWEQRPFLVMRYCSKGSSSSLVGKIDETELWHFIHDVAAGLEYLHGMPNPIIHQDIKPDNILLDDSGRYLITGFGISKKIRSTMSKQSDRTIGFGAIAYMAPERFGSDSVPIKSSDIWSLGVSIYELATGELPFDGLGGGMQRNGAEIPILDERWSESIAMVMRSCLAKEPWNRPTAQQLKEYSEAIIKGERPYVLWVVPPGVDKIPSTEPNPTLLQGEEEEETDYIEKKKRKVTAISIFAVIAIAFFVWVASMGEKKNTAIAADNEYVVDTVQTRTREPIEERLEDVSNDKEDEQKKAETIRSVTPLRQTAGPRMNTEEPEVKGDIKQLETALDRGDYQAVQRLADRGCAAAYGPLAKYYLRNHDYKTAEIYAKRAKAAGFRDGITILQSLKDLGYYD